jgi:NAD dependent epimerase/dehydratase family enzyme
VNTVGPGAVTNAEFTKTLGNVLGRPTLFPVPAFAVRLAFGEMADELLLSSTRVEPKRLRETNYQFAYQRLEAALRHVLKK